MLLGALFLWTSSFVFFQGWLGLTVLYCIGTGIAFAVGGRRFAAVFERSAKDHSLHVSPIPGEAPSPLQGDSTTATTTTTTADDATLADRTADSRRGSASPAAHTSEAAKQKRRARQIVTTAKNIARGVAIFLGGSALYNVFYMLRWLEAMHLSGILVLHLGVMCMLMATARFLHFMIRPSAFKGVRASVEPVVVSAGGRYDPGSADHTRRSSLDTYPASPLAPPRKQIPEEPVPDHAGQRSSWSEFMAHREATAQKNEDDAQKQQLVAAKAAADREEAVTAQAKVIQAFIAQAKAEDEALGLGGTEDIEEMVDLVSSNGSAGSSAESLLKHVKCELPK